MMLPARYVLTNEVGGWKTLEAWIAMNGSLHTPQDASMMPIGEQPSGVSTVVSSMARVMPVTIAASKR